MKKKKNRDKGEFDYPLKELKEFLVMEGSAGFDCDKCLPGFERLWIWQKAFKLMKAIHKFCKTLPYEEKYKLRDQVERSSSSVCDNSAEGYSSYYYDDKIKGLNTARKEAGETQNHIRKLMGKGYLNCENGLNWISEYEEIVRGINGFIRYIRNKKRRI